jgi:hypothetical protein
MSLSSNADARSAKLKTSFQKLTAASTKLNLVSGAFGEAVRALDDALSKLNPGIEAWVTTARLSEDDTPWEADIHQLGFTRLRLGWGLAISRYHYDENLEERTNYQSWDFNDAPRELRIEAINHIPLLVDELAKEAEKAANRVAEGATLAQELAKIITANVINKDERR